MKIILDTNIIISGLFWHGTPAKILEKVVSRKLTLCFSESTFQEISKVLNYPKFKSEIEKLSFEVGNFLAKLTQKAIIYSNSEVKLNTIKDDPSDNRFLECALMSGVKYIVSGDRHLLKLKKFQNIAIISPRQFLKVFNNNEEI